MSDVWGPSEEAAIRLSRGRVWHRLRNRQTSESVDGIPALQSWVACRARVLRADAVTRWGRPPENACRRCWS